MAVERCFGRPADPRLEAGPPALALWAAAAWALLRGAGEVARALSEAVWRFWPDTLR
jgi:hypothetical protein